MKLDLTGNPFVDTGLAVLASKSGCNSIDELTLEKVKEVHNGSELARRNSKFKSTSMIFTTNTLLTNPSIKPAEKRSEFYAAIITAFLNKIGHEDSPERCESCGNSKSLNIDNVIAETLIPLGYKKDGNRYIGRDWFPLAGSIGSDAQALPAGSRSPNLCAKCLFSVHYLPQGVILREGKLAVFQSTSTKFWYDLVKPIVVKINNQAMFGTGKLDMLGSKEGSKTVLTTTFAAMDKLARMESGISLFMWLFSNSGQGPDCKIDEIPNNALQFLFNAYVNDYEDDILNLVSRDGSSENSFLYCISAGRDYYRLYPNENSKGVQPELFWMYQTEICKTQETSLIAAHKIAQQLRKREPDNKKYETLCKGLITNDDKHKNKTKYKIKKLIVEMVGDSSLTYNEYITLFAEDSENSIGTKSNAWGYISYFARNTDWIPKEVISSDTTIPSMFQYVARQIFNSYITERGVVRFKSEVLDRLAVGKIDRSWLRRQFLKNALNNAVFTYSTWASLSSDKNGQENLFEAFYRFRLLWTEWFKTPDMYIDIALPDLPSYTPELDLPANIKADVSEIVQIYLKQRRCERFKKEVIADLVAGRKGFWWFKQKFEALNRDYYTEHFWETFLTDDTGYSIVSIRLFQLSLELIKNYRQQVFKSDAS